MSLEMEQTLLPRQTTTISAQLITSLKILQLSSAELTETLQQEMTENPMLDVEERDTCSVCGATLYDGYCTECYKTAGQEQSSQDAVDFRPEDYESTSYADIRERNSSGQIRDDDFDPLSLVSTQITLADYLRGILHTALPESELAIADYIIESLDDSGYLAESCAEIAEQCGVSEERVEAVLSCLQRQEPAGIGARDVRECLLRQVEHLREAGLTDPHTELILTECFSELGEQKTKQIALRLGLSAAEVAASLAFIRSNLTPFPAFSFWRDGGHISRDSSGYVRPDVAITRTTDGYAVEVLESERYNLGVNDYYRSLMGNSDGLSSEDRDFMQKHASRAKFFVDCVRQRWATLRTITECIVEFQQDFLDHGVRHLKPLTLVMVASQVGVHESTVSRATANKYVLLPDKRVISFDDLFDGSLAVKDKIREIIDNEDRARPLSDQDLGDRLQEAGIFIARRTVAKYRENMHILPSNLRARMAC